MLEGINFAKMKQKVKSSSANVDKNQSANSSIGLFSDLSAALNDSVSVSQLMNRSDFLDVSAMDALVGDENGVNSNSQNVKRSRRNIKKKEYSEGACNDTNDISLSEDDDVADTIFCPKGISDSISDSDRDGSICPPKKR